MRPDTALRAPRDSSLPVRWIERASFGVASIIGAALVAAVSWVLGWALWQVARGVGHLVQAVAGTGRYMSADGDS
jgi:hypothetical protein